MRKSKYVGKQFGNWTCTAIGIANVQGKRAKWAGHLSYYYIMERMTSDNKAEKMIRLNCSEASKVYQGLITVEEILDKREAKNSREFTRKVSYHFVDKEVK